jgi:hypothetical protein
MNTPGFTAEGSLNGAGAAYKGLVRSNTAGDGRIIPALPPGGLPEIECVQAICRESPKLCSSAWKICASRY